MTKSGCVFDLPKLESEIAQLTEQSQQPGFWDDTRAAQVTMRRLTALQDQVDRWRGLGKRATDLQELLQLATEEGENDLIEEVADTCVLYGVENPTPAAGEQAEIIVRQCEQIVAAMRSLDDFKRGKRWMLLAERIANLREVGHAVDEGHRLLAEALAHPVAVIALMGLFVMRLPYLYGVALAASLGSDDDALQAMINGGDTWTVDGAVR